MDRPGIVVAGSINTDMVVRTDHLPLPGETVLGGDFMMNQGGKGANQAVAAARLGGSVAMIGRTGSDVFGRQSLESLQNEGIDISGVASDPFQTSGVALITVDSKGENCIAVSPGANACVSMADIDRSAGLIRSAGWLLLQLEIPLDAVVYAASLARQSGVRVILNPAPARLLPAELYGCTDLLVPNRREAGFLAGMEITDRDSAAQASAVLEARGIPAVIITLGEWGALVREGGEVTFIEAFPVKAVDTTAAGDAFCGAVCVALSEGGTLKEAARFACAAAAVAVGRAGAMASLPRREEVGRAPK